MASMGTFASRIGRFIGYLLWFAAGALLLGACMLPPVEVEEGPSTEYDHVLPAGWRAVRDWQPVNLDDDEEAENLLLFRFDNGQVGALLVEGDPAAPSDPPHQLLPRLFDEHRNFGPGDLGQGVIAAPGTMSQAITVTEVSGSNPMKELVILGGGTHLTFVWWKGEGHGYGVTQIYAAGGFGVDWGTWYEEPMPLTSVMAYEPLDDYRARANLCRIVLYTRRTDLPSELPTIIFSPQPQGLHFCGSRIPDYPFAPEGVVMAYLHDPRVDNGAMLKFMTPGITPAQVDAESGAEHWPLEYIADIAAYRSLPMRQEQALNGPSPTTTVCVEFAEKANPAVRRWVLYTLRYQPSDPTQRQPERWTVSGALREPPPLQPPPAGYCETILQRNAP